MDAEAVAWARRAVSAGAAESGGVGVGVGGGDSNRHVGKTSNAVSKDISRGALSDESDGIVSDLAAICRDLNINIASTRHLVICVQSNLLAVPNHLRNASGGGGDVSAGVGVGELGAAQQQSAGGGGSNWFDRKTRCDALLSLCKYFAQQIVNKH